MENSGLSEQLILFLASFSGFTAYMVILGVLLACGFGVPIPEDITLIAAGVLAGLGKISVTGAYLVGFFGVLAGDSILFFIGRKFGKRAFEWPLFRKFFTPDRIHRAEKHIRKRARMICFIARFLPGLRAPIYLTSGAMGVKPSIFLFQDGLAALLSVPLWIFLGQMAGENLEFALEKAKELQLFIFGGLALFFGFLVYKYIRKKKASKTPRVTDTQNEKVLIDSDRA